MAFEKKHGEKANVDMVIVAKRRVQYENALTVNALDYDTWFDYIRIEEEQVEAEQEDESRVDVGQMEAATKRVREVYERAIAERSRAIYELAVNQPSLDMPELLWKSYIDFEVESLEADLARTLMARKRMWIW